MNQGRYGYVVYICGLMLLQGILALPIAHASMGQSPTSFWVDQRNGSDANDGLTKATAFETLQHAIDQSKSGRSDSERSRITVRDGVYGIRGQRADTTCGNRTRFEAAIRIVDLDYLTIEAAPGHNPSIKPPANSERYFLSAYIENSRGLTVNNIDSDQTVTQFDHWLVCNVEYLIVRDSVFHGGEDGIDFDGTLRHALIEGNVFRSVDDAWCDSALDFVSGCYEDIVIQDNQFLNTIRHIIVKPGTSAKRAAVCSGARRFLIQRNVMVVQHRESEEAVRFIGLKDGVLQNNIISGSSQQGLYVDTGSQHISVLHNTFFNNGMEVIRTKVTNDSLWILNNILYGNGEYAAISVPGTKTRPSGFHEDYNLVYNVGSKTESPGDVPLNRFGDHTIVGEDPLFVNAVPKGVGAKSVAVSFDDLRLEPRSPAIGAGTDVGVTDDIVMNPRPNPCRLKRTSSCAPDIGAYEMPQ